MEITKIWQKSRDFWFGDFFLELSLKSIGWYGFFYGFLVVLNLFHQMFCSKLLLILIFTNTVLSKKTFGSIVVF